MERRDTYSLRRSSSYSSHIDNDVIKAVCKKHRDEIGEAAEEDPEEVKGYEKG